MPRDYTDPPQADDSWITGVLVLALLAGLVLCWIGFWAVYTLLFETCLEGPEGPSHCVGGEKYLAPVGLVIVAASIAGLVAGARRRRAAWEAAL